MEFEFDKFVIDLEKRQHDNGQSNTKRIDEVEMDRLRRLRAERYHERWQNRIVWEDKK